MMATQPTNRLPEVNGDHETFDVTSLGEVVRLTKEERVELTHTAAREHLDLAEFVGERIVRQHHVDSLTDAMLRGTFRWEWVTLVVARCREAHGGHPAGTTFRVNGQHTCWARLECPGSMRAPVRVARYACATENDLRQLYASCDRGAPRTKSNVIRAYVAGHEKFERFKSHAVKYVPAGLAMWLWESKHERRKHDGDDVAYLMLTDHYNVCCRVMEFLSRGRKQDVDHLLRSPVTAAMLATFDKAPQRADEFWSAVHNGVGFEDKDDARLRLRSFVMRYTVGHGGGTHSSREAVDVERYYRTCLVCWNAWRRGKKVKTIRVPDQRPDVA